MQLTYEIDGAPVHLELDGVQRHGQAERLIDLYPDPLSGHDWYERGYTVQPVFSETEMRTVRNALADIIRAELDARQIATDGFTLEHYHRFVTNEAHAAIINRTRRLSLRDVGLDEDVLGRLSEVVGFPLSLFNPLLDSDQWVICRINRPGSRDFNPVHKDIYEALDRARTIPPMVNIWIPICGVSGRTGLPVAPGSHLIPEDRILRTRAGSMVNGVHYSVNSVTSWDGQAALVTIVPEPGMAMVFSSHLIHGLGRNLHADTTRISFELRLFAS